MMQLFAGNEGAYGTYGKPYRDNGGLKCDIKNTARTVPEPVTLQRWVEHLEGKRALGIIPICKDDTCVWGAIDVDSYDRNSLDIVELVERLRLPLVAVRSKSGGLHLLLFTQEPQRAADVRAVLHKMAADLGLSGSEIFPKQDRLEGGKVGNWLAAPYFGSNYDGAICDQVALRKTGAAKDVVEFLRTAKEQQLNAEQFAQLVSAAQGPGRKTNSKALGRYRGSRTADVADAACKLKQYADEVAASQEGTRNSTLNKRSYQLGQEVARGSIARDEVEQEMTRAGLACGLPPDEVTNTVKRAIDDGMQHPEIGPYRDEHDFDVDNHGRPLAVSQRNVRTALRRLGARVRHDTFQDRMIVEGLDGVGPLLDDRAMERLWLEVDARFHFRPSKDFFFTVVSDEAWLNSFHPVREYLDALCWDGVKRIDNWLLTYAGADDTPYTRAVGKLLVVAACRRVRSPGCKFDEMVVLESKQGADKSTALALMAMRDDWFGDDLPLNVEAKRVIEALNGRWIVEAAELKGMRRGDIEHLKSFLSRRRDRARMSYDRLVTEVPRQCVIVGTTNSTQYLRDTTGNRRFWPVAVKKFDLDALTRDRDQLWAEAAAREVSGESIRLDPSLWEAAAQEQERRVVDEPFTQVIEEVLGELDGKVRAADVWKTLDIREGQRTQEHNARLGEAMRQLGWTRVKLRFGDSRKEWGYCRGAGADREQRIYVYYDHETKGLSASHTPPSERDEREVPQDLF